MLPQAAEPTQPLGNLVVVDLTRVISGAFLTLLFADFGAEVIKVEHPEGGDPLRTWSPGDTELWSKVYNRNKKSITLNLASVRGQELLRRLVQQAELRRAPFQRMADRYAGVLLPVTRVKSNTSPGTRPRGSARLSPFSCRQDGTRMESG